MHPIFTRETESPVSQNPHVPGWFHLQVVAVAWILRTVSHWASVFIVPGTPLVQRRANGQGSASLLPARAPGPGEWGWPQRARLTMVQWLMQGLAVALSTLSPVQAGYRRALGARFTWLCLDLLQFPLFKYIFPFQNSMRRSFSKVDHF